MTVVNLKLTVAQLSPRTCDALFLTFIIRQAAQNLEEIWHRLATSRPTALHGAQRDAGLGDICGPLDELCELRTPHSARPPQTEGPRHRGFLIVVPELDCGTPHAEFNRGAIAQRTLQGPITHRTRAHWGGGRGKAPSPDPSQRLRRPTLTSP